VKGKNPVALRAGSVKGKNLVVLRVNSAKGPRRGNPGGVPDCFGTLCLATTSEILNNIKERSVISSQ